MFTNFTQPVIVTELTLIPSEVMYYLYYPISSAGMKHFVLADRRLEFLRPLIDAVETDEPAQFTRDNVYLTVKRMFVGTGISANRPGYHCDGFMTGDLNYIWYDNTPTIFNRGEFYISEDDSKSLSEFEEQAKPENEYMLDSKILVKLNSTVIHKVNTQMQGLRMRTFIKVTLSQDVFNLAENSVNTFFQPTENQNLVRNSSRNQPFKKN